MEQQPEHEDASEVAAPQPSWTRPAGSVSGVALGEVFGDLASWKSAPGWERPAPLAAPTERAGDAGGVDGPAAGDAGGVDGAAAGVDPAGGDVSPAGSVLDWLEVAQQATEKALAEPVWRHGADALAAAMRLIGQLRNCLDRVEVAVAAEAVSQGAPGERGLSPLDWLVDAAGAAAPKPDVQHAARVLNVATAMDAAEPASDVFGRAVRSGAMPLSKADLVSRFVKDVRGLADPQALAGDIGSLVEAASDNERGRGLTVRELRRAIQFATQLIKPAKDLERDEHRARLARSLHKSQGPAGMSRYQLTLDAEGRRAGCGRAGPLRTRERPRR